MENRKLIKIATLTILLWGGLIITPYTFAYQIDTHQFLTSEAINLYNRNADNSISDNLQPYLLDGTRREDDPPRWLNHFHDPIRDRGLAWGTIANPTNPIGLHIDAKVWAQHDIEQSQLAYNPIIATILSSIQNKRIERFLPTSNFTWEAGLRYWIQGDKEMAMFTLGHILHLAQDLASPSHTRNDSTIDGDPYEDWAGQFTVQNPDQSIVAEVSTLVPFSKLVHYLENISQYSNRNFYSKDTIGLQSGYEEPQPQEYIRIGNIFYGTNKIDGKEYNLFGKTQPTFVFSNNVDSFIDDSLILQDYWSFLAPKSIEYGAGIIDLFFAEAERNKDNPEYTKKSFLGQVVDAAKNIINQLFGDGTYESVGEITFSDADPQDTDTQTTQPQETQPPPLPKQIPQLKQTPPQEQDAPEPLTVTRVIDGDTIELNNGERVRYIGANAPELSKSQCWAQEAKQYNEQLVLNKHVRLEQDGEDKDAFGRLLRYVWVGDTLINQQLIEEGAAYSFNFNIPHSKNDIFENTENEAKEARRGLWGDTCNPEEEPEEQQTEATSQQTACSFPTSQSPQHTPIIINEVAWMGSTSSSNDEWIELYNKTNSSIDITGWTIVDTAEQISVVFGKEGPTSIPAKSYYLLERTDDSTVPSVAADTLYTGALSNSNEGLRLFNTTCQLIDEVLADSSWPAGQNTSKRTMERSTTLGWHTSSSINGTPKQANGSPYITGGGGGAGSPSNTPGNNPTPKAPATTSSGQSADNVVISELLIAGDTANDEFIELYNPTDNPISLDGYSIQYLSGQASSTTNIVGEDLGGEIPALGFFLTAQNNSTYINQADIPYSFSLSGISSGASVFLVSTTTPITSPSDNTIVDQISYGSVVHQHLFSLPSPDANTSLERAAISEGACLTAQQEGEFLGNACESDSENDFAIRTTPTPQGTSSLPEPRNPPTPPISFAATHNSTTTSITFSWEPNQGDLLYEIDDNEDVSTPPLLQSTSTPINMRTMHVGNEYDFYIRAVDRDGLGSSYATSTVAIPSFINDALIYPHPSEDGAFILDVRHDNYPFIPDIFNRGEQWKLLVAYLNTPAEYQPVIYNSWEPDDLSHVIPIEYPGCVGILLEDDSVMLPDSADHCGVGGGPLNRSFDISELEDGRLIMYIRPTQHPDYISATPEQNYITLAFYSTHSHGLGPYFGIVAVDDTPYHFSTTAPQTLPPSTPQNFSATFQSPNTDPHFLLSWDESTDPDSPDDKIKYEFNHHHINESFDEQQWSLVLDKTISATQAGEHTLYIRAKDETGLYSDIATTTATASIPTTIIQTQAPNPSSSFIDFKTDGVRRIQKLAQSFILGSETTITLLRLAIEKTPNAICCSYDARISIQTGIENQDGVIIPSGNEVWNGDAINIDRYSQGTKPHYVQFSPDVTLDSGTYFIILESVEEGDPRDPRLASEQLLTYTNSNSYPDGTMYILYSDQQGWMAKTYDLYCVIKGTIQ